MPVKVGKYRLGDTIAIGTYSEIKLCTDETTGECHAVKVIKRASLDGLNNERDIYREVKILSELRHESIVSVHDVLMSETKCYIVMELVRGGDLADKVSRGRHLLENEAREVFCQIAEAITYCHQKGVYHRDIKLENVLIDGNGRAKLTDFGLGCISQDTILHTQCGTPMYIAPEVIMKAKHGYSGEKIDVWECGVLLYACLVGFLPFRDTDNQGVFRKIVFDPIVLPEEIPAAARDLLSHMLDRNAERRWRMSDVLQHPWCRGVPTSPEFERTAGAVDQVNYSTISLKEKRSILRAEPRPRATSDVQTSPRAGAHQDCGRGLPNDGERSDRRAHSDLCAANVASKSESDVAADCARKRSTVAPLDVINKNTIVLALKSLTSPRALAKDTGNESCGEDVRSPPQRRQKAILEKPSRTIKHVMHILHRPTA
mmetsp:Transcript_82/g.232  ORF Transcript_82/g.232 Transcript_82/m.232 type:complete len:430 (-) Transcript_82:20-1309(-)